MFVRNETTKTIDMSIKNEETTLQKVERELQEFQQKKTSAENSLKDELLKAKTQYDSVVKDIEAKYKVDEYAEDIKRHTYFLRLLKREVPIPDDLNAKKGKAKTTTRGKRVDDWYGKFQSALSKLGKTVADNPKKADVQKVIDELYPDLGYKQGAFDNAWTTFKKKA
jgi:hypothetical protein